MKVYFRYMGAVWSCTPATHEALQQLVEADKAFSLDEFADVREVKRAPAGRTALRLMGRFVESSSR